MKSLAILAAALAATMGVAHAASLPDLKGRTVIAVTENAYTPLNFADPKTGQGIGWEYDAVQRDRQAAQPQGRVEAVELGHHDPGRAAGPL